jgi:putative inorganic carbon (hco3(-)) transporter
MPNTRQPRLQPLPYCVGLPSALPLPPPRTPLAAARLLSLAAAAVILLSIALKEILLGAAILALLLSRERWRMPSRWTLPLALFFAGTLLALALSPDPRAGLPQLKKFYAYLILPLLYTTLRGPADARLALTAATALGLLSSLWSFWQFAAKWTYAAQHHWDFYAHYIAQRTTGFMSHWQTFGGQLGILIPVALAALLFAPMARRERQCGALALGVLSLAMTLNLTRSIYIATALAVVYLLAAWRPRTLWLVPLTVMAALAIPPVRQRAISLVRPQGQTDSNEHRLVTWRTGLAMIAANPWKGVGPDRVDEEFARYQPADVQKLPEGWYGHLHNIYLQYAADRGVPVLAVFCWLLLAMLRTCWRARRTWLGAAGIAAWIGVIVSGFFEANLANSEVLHLFLVVMVCAAKALDADGAPETAGSA